jgi:hypothetical protein
MKVLEESSMAKPDPWEIFRQGCEGLSEEFFDAMESRDRLTPQVRDWEA